MVSFLVLMESLETPPGAIPMPGEVGVGASVREPEFVDAVAPIEAELGPGEDIESAPEEEEEERRRCLSEPFARPLMLGIWEDGGETEDDVDEEVVGTAAKEERGDDDDVAEAP